MGSHQTDNGETVGVDLGLTHPSGRNEQPGLLG
jgi:hypothetical protein